MKFPLAIHQKPTLAEIIPMVIIIALTFIPFIYGINSSQPKYCFSLLVGVVGIKLYNIATKNKFTISKIIQKNASITFQKDGVEISEQQNSTPYPWEELNEIDITIFTYKGKVKSQSGGERTYYSGIENNFKFTKNNMTYDYLFYIENATELEEIQNLFITRILPTLYQLKNIKNENLYIAKLDFTDLQKFKSEYDINKYTDQVYFN